MIFKFNEPYILCQNNFQMYWPPIVRFLGLTIGGQFNKEAYDESADEIFKLREQREKCTVATAARDAQIARINELQDFIKQQPAHLEAFDESLVKRWLERIIVWEDHFTVELKSGLKIDIEE